MIKKLLSVVLCVLALNFLAGAGGIYWLFQSGHLNKDKLKQIRELVMTPPATEPTTQPTAAGPTTRHALDIDALLAQETGRSVADQVQFMRQMFESRLAELDHRELELQDLKQQVDLANQKLATDRQTLEKRQKALNDQAQEATRLASDQGFQDSLQLYVSMPGKQAKDIFMTLDEPTVQQYLQAMQPRTAAKIVKEFKSPEEKAFIQKVLEGMRQAQASADGKSP